MHAHARTHARTHTDAYRAQRYMPPDGLAKRYPPGAPFGTAVDLDVRTRIHSHPGGAACFLDSGLLHDCLYDFTHTPHTQHNTNARNTMRARVHTHTHTHTPSHATAWCAAQSVATAQPIQTGMCSPIIHTHTHTHTHIHHHTHTRTHFPRPRSISAHTHLHTPAHTHTYTLTHARAHTHVHTHAHTYTHARACSMSPLIYTCVCVCCTPGYQ